MSASAWLAGGNEDRWDGNWPWPAGLAMTLALGSGWCAVLLTVQGEIGGYGPWLSIALVTAGLVIVLGVWCPAEPAAMDWHAPHASPLPARHRAGAVNAPGTSGRRPHSDGSADIDLRLLVPEADGTEEIWSLLAWVQGGPISQASSAR